MVNPLDVLTLEQSSDTVAQRQSGTVAKQVLHIGCGTLNPAPLHASFAGWRVVRLDADPATKPDVVSSLTQMAGVATDSMDAVYSYRVLQQLYAHEVPLALAEFRRVLRPDGFVLLSTPDLHRLAEIIASGKVEEPLYTAKSGPIYPLDILFGHRSSIAQGKIALASRTGFTAHLLGYALVRAGFSEVRIQPAELDLWGSARKGTTPATSFTLLDPPAKSS
jgi:predicted SAM-dependent methyltransferase